MQSSVCSRPIRKHIMGVFNSCARERTGKRRDFPRNKRISSRLFHLRVHRHLFFSTENFIMSGFDDPGIYYSENFGGGEGTGVDEGGLKRIHIKRRFREFLRQFRIGTDRTGFTYKYRWREWKASLTDNLLMRWFEIYSNNMIKFHIVWKLHIYRYGDWEDALSSQHELKDSSLPGLTEATTLLYGEYMTHSFVFIRCFIIKCLFFKKTQLNVITLKQYLHYFYAEMSSRDITHWENFGWKWRWRILPVSMKICQTAFTRCPLRTCPWSVYDVPSSYFIYFLISIFREYRLSQTLVH